MGLGHKDPGEWRRGGRCIEVRTQKGLLVAGDPTISESLRDHKAL